MAALAYHAHCTHHASMRAVMIPELACACWPLAVTMSYGLALTILLDMLPFCTICTSRVPGRGS